VANFNAIFFGAQRDLSAAAARADAAQGLVFGHLVW
jgi:hypothetical protein